MVWNILLILALLYFGVFFATLYVVFSWLDSENRIYGFVSTVTAVFFVPWMISLILVSALIGFYDSPETLPLYMKFFYSSMIPALIPAVTAIKGIKEKKWAAISSGICGILAITTLSSAVAFALHIASNA